MPVPSGQLTTIAALQKSQNRKAWGAHAGYVRGAGTLRPGRWLLNQSCYEAWGPAKVVIRSFTGPVGYCNPRKRQTSEAKFKMADRVWI